MFDSGSLDFGGGDGADGLRRMRSVESGVIHEWLESPPRYSKRDAALRESVGAAEWGRTVAAARRLGFRGACDRALEILDELIEMAESTES